MGPQRKSEETRKESNNKISHKKAMDTMEHTKLQPLISLQRPLTRGV